MAIRTNLEVAPSSWTALRSSQHQGQRSELWYMKVIEAKHLVLWIFFSPRANGFKPGHLRKDVRNRNCTLPRSQESKADPAHLEKRPSQQKSPSPGPHAIESPQSIWFCGASTWIATTCITLRRCPVGQIGNVCPCISQGLTVLL